MYHVKSAMTKIPSNLKQSTRSIKLPSMQIGAILLTENVFLECMIKDESILTRSRDTLAHACVSMHFVV